MINKRKKEVPLIAIQLGEKLQEIIKLKKLRQRDVAHDANLDVENLRKYLKGRQEMRISTLLRIVEALEISLEDLFNGLYSKK